MKKIKNKELIKNIVIFAVMPIIITVILEAMSSRDIFGGINKLILDPYVFLCNALIVASSMSVGLLLGRFRFFWLGITSGTWLVLGLINLIVTLNRTLPFTAYDLQLLDTLPLIIKKYLSPFYLAVVCLFIVALLLGLIVTFGRALSSSKEKGSFKSSLIIFLIINLLTCGNVQLAVHTGILEVRFQNLAEAFTDNGFTYSFIVSLIDNGVKRVDGYSKELIEDITDEFELTDKNEIKKPNIIFLQMESFFDPTSLKSVKFDRDPIPNFRALTEDCPSGLLTVPVIGAGTVNTEFEVVTGMRTADFGAGEYPYKTILTDTPSESIANNLKPFGYTSHFIHNYKGGFYGRNNVYANLGYDNFYSVEYMVDYELNENGWAKDKILLRYINECLDSTEGVDHIEAVSVQGHGSYGDIKKFKRHIKVSSCDNESLKTSYEYYINQIYEMDLFLGELINSLSERDEETVLVIYGDHLPSLNIDNSQLSERHIYQSDYVIWNNLGIEYSDEDIYAYQLSAKVMKELGIRDGVINSCHQTYKGEAKYLFNLQALSYDILYGKRYAFGENEPYVRSDMAINRRKMRITGVEEKKGEDNIYIVHGEGFSEKSHVRVGFKVAYTKFINETTLEFRSRGCDLSKPISVWEKDIGESNEYLMEMKNEEKG
ncbi:MAG: LTA synthase family protein [Ruminococcaceae bacterium]|nr:LTA synthase family protein [Oscillospiraceae bacterium]